MIRDGVVWIGGVQIGLQRGALRGLKDLAHRAGWPRAVARRLRRPDSWLHRFTVQALLPG